MSVASTPALANPTLINKAVGFWADKLTECAPKLTIKMGMMMIFRVPFTLTPEGKLKFVESLSASLSADYSKTSSLVVQASLLEVDERIQIAARAAGLPKLSGTFPETFKMLIKDDRIILNGIQMYPAVEEKKQS